MIMKADDFDFDDDAERLTPPDQFGAPLAAISSATAKQSAGIRRMDLPHRNPAANAGNGELRIQPTLVEPLQAIRLTPELSSS